MEIKSPHFSVITDAGEHRGREVAIRFEQMRAVFAHLMANAYVNIPIPLQIVAFRNSKELRQVSPLYNGKPIEVAGLFQGGSDRCFIMLDMGVENPWNVVFHEYAHQLMNGTITARMDPWFEEGFAEYFSSIEVGSHQAHVGKITDMTYSIVRQRGMMKVADLFRVQQSSSTYNESGDKRTVFYAESAMVVHYIFDKQMLPQLSKYFELKIDKNVPVEDAIQQSFGMSAANFNNTIQSYVADGRYSYYSMKTPDDIETTGYTTAPLSSLDGAAVIADIHFHSRDYHEKAVSEFGDILKADPANAAALRGMGYVYLQKRDLEQAREYFQRAAKSNPKDPRLHYYTGLLMNMQFDGSDISTATNELQTAIALDPGFADAYMQLAWVESRGGNIPFAIENAKKAISLNPRNQGYYFNLADLYMRAEQPEHALSIFRALAKSSDQAMALRATAALDQVEQMEKATQETRAAMDNSTAVPVRTSVSPSTQVLESSDAVKFLKGTITAVDCSSSPKAAITVSSSNRNWTMQVADIHHVLVLGTTGLSCEWNKQKVALNYRETGEKTGTIVSIEIQ